MSLADIRREYQGAPLDEAHSEGDPFAQFRAWFDQVREHEIDPTAMALATATPDGRPANRIVLLKGLDQRGLVFFTNYRSRKGHELAANARASVLFYWPSLNRQVRVDGTVEKVTARESDDYFASRPIESQVAATISPQSEPLSSREALDALFGKAMQERGTASAARPSFWGGYRLVPEEFEFWQGRVNRLHDRLRYRKTGAEWTRDRLAP